MHKIQLKPHHFIQLKGSFALQSKDSEEDICTDASLYEFYQELLKEKSLPEVFMSLRKKNLLRSVKDVALFIRELQAKNFFAGGKSEKSSLGLKSIRTGLSSSAPVAWLFEVLIFAIAALGSLLFLQGPRTYDFFTELSGLLAVSTAILWLAAYGLSRAAFMLILVRWHCGFYPPLFFKLTGANFGFRVPVASLTSLPKIRQASVWLAMALSPLVFSTAGYLFFKGSIGISMMWLGILFTFKNLNPMKDSDLSKFLRIVIGTNDWEHLLPYLKTKSLTAVAQKKVKSVQESRLVAFSSLSVLWIVIFCSLAFDIALTNYPRWIFGLQSGGEHLGAALISMALFAFVAGEAVLSLGHVLIGNFAAIPAKWRNNNSSSGTETNWSRQDIKTQIKSSPVFEDLSEAQWDSLLAGGKVRSYKKGAKIIRQGEAGEQMYFVLKGSCEVSKTADTGLATKLAKVSEGAVFGEVSLLEKLTRTASVTAMEDSILFMIDRTTFEKVWSTGPDINQALKKRIFLSRAMSSSALLKDVPPEISDIFLEKGIVEKFPTQTPIVKEGDFSKYFYIILQGRVTVLKGGKSLAELSAGQFFGEIAMLEESPRVATVTTQDDTTVLRLQVEDFWEIISQNMQLALNIEATALQNNNLI